MCNAEDFKRVFYKGLEKAGVAIVFIAAWWWTQYTSDKRYDGQMEILKEMSKVTAEQTEVVRQQSYILQQLVVKVERLEQR